MANNIFVITGKLTKFEIRKAGSEHKIAELTIAAYNGKDADCPVYVQVKQWNPSVKTKKMLKRLEGEGRVQATGRARMDTWDDKETDERQFKLYLLADDRDGLLEADEPSEDDDNDDNKRRGKKDGGGKKKRGNKNIKKKKDKGKKKRREEEEDDDDDDEDDEGEDDDDDDWDEDD